MLQRFFILIFGAFFLAASASTVIAQTQSLTLPQTVQQGRELLNNQRPDQAFKLFRQQESFHAGNPQFDYWYGVAALRNGKAIEASVALERVIAQQPLHAGARIELVAVYIQLNQFDAAERQLDFLEGLNAPIRAQEAMERFRTVIAQRRTGATNNPHLYTLSLDVGYDSNYLNYPDSFDLFANTILQGLAILEADSTTYTNLRGMAWKRWNLPAGSFVEGSLMGQMRRNHTSEARIFNTAIIHSMLSVGTRVGNSSELRMGIEASHLRLDNSPYRTHSGFSIGFQTRLDSMNELLLNGAFRQFRFDESRNDYTSWSGDAELRHTLNKTVRLRSKIGADYEYVTREITRQGGDSHKLFANVHADFVLSQHHQVLTTLGYERQRYSNEGFAVFNRGKAAIRSDNSLRARAEWVYMPTLKWRYSLFGQYRDQRSSIGFFGLDQSLVQGSVTYVF